MSDLDYENGQRELARRILGDLLPLIPDGDIDKWKLERMDIVAKLREICDEFGDNDWSDDLHLGDVLEKHLLRHLHSEIGAKA